MFLISFKKCSRNFNEFQYQWTVSKVSAGRCNAANIMPLHHRPQKIVSNKKKPIEIWTNLFTQDVIAMVLNHNNDKITAVIKQLPEEICNIDKYTYIREVTEKSFLLWYLTCKVFFWINFSKTDKFLV